MKHHLQVLSLVVGSHDIVIYSQVDVHFLDVCFSKSLQCVAPTI